MVFTQSPAAAEVFTAAATSGRTTETVVVDGGQLMTVQRDLSGAKYRLDGKVVYATDAGSLLTGILVWGQDATDILLPAGGRRRDRSLIKAPRFLKKELLAGGPVRVFHQRLGDLWAVERPGHSLVVRHGSGEALEFCKLVDGVPGEIESERPWCSLSEEQHVARIALWSQILALLARTPREQSLAEDLRVAAFEAADAPRCTVDMIVNHIAVRSRDLTVGRWSERLYRRPSMPAARASQAPAARASQAPAARPSQAPAARPSQAPAMHFSLPSFSSR
jgi:hypothetical protein